MKNFWKKFFSENLTIKVFSILLACLLEAYFYSPDNSITESFYAYAKINNLPSNLMLTKRYSFEQGLRVRIKIKGPRPLVKQVINSEHFFNIKLPNNFGSKDFKSDSKNVKSGKRFATSLDIKDLGLSSGVSVESIEPRTLELVFEEKVKKALNVKMRFSGDLPKGLKLSSANLNMKKIFVTGPKRDLDKVTELYTEVIQLDEIFKSEKREVRIEEIGQRVELEHPTVKLEIKLKGLIP